MRNAKAIQSKSKTHQVTQLTSTTYEVKSGSSGSVYTVTLSNQPQCSCDWGKYRKAGSPCGCSHVLSVYAYIAEWTGRKVSAWASEEDAKRQKKQVVDLGDGITLTTRITRKADPILVNWPTGAVIALEVEQVEL
jgi:hypothetical protein